jgi:hypothetical protein
LNLYSAVLQSSTASGSEHDSKKTKERKWTAEVTQNSDAMDLERGVFKSDSPLQDRPILEALRRAQRAPKVISVPLGDVDVDVLPQ